VKAPWKWRRFAGFLFGSIALASVGTLLHQSTVQFRFTRDQVKNCRDILDALQAFLTTAEEAETGQRGYLLTGDQTYLEPYNLAVSEIDSRLQRIQELTANDPSQQAAALLLRQHVERKMDELRRTVQLRRAQDIEASRKLVLSGVGKEEMNQIRSLVAEMQQYENRRADDSNQKYEASAVKRERLFAGAVVLQFVLLALVFVFIDRDRTNRSRSAFEILQGNLRLSAILRTIGEGLYQVDGNGRLVYLNPVGEQLLGYKAEEILGQSAHDLLHTGANDGKSCADDCPLISVTTQGGTRHSPSDWLRRRDGSLMTVEYTCSPLLQYGIVHGAVVVFRDIGERSRIEQALRESEERYRNLVEKSGGLICTHDLQGTLLSVNEASAQALGYSPEELKGKNLRELLTPAARPKLDWYLKAISEWSAHSGLMHIVTKGGDEIVWSYSNRLINQPGSDPYVLGYAQDVTAQVLTEQALKVSEEKLQAALENEKRVSRVDFLTRIPNRRTFYEAVESESKRARRYQRAMTLAYIDVDKFKEVNDLFGHSVGDDLLKLIGAEIQSSIRSTDMVARLGGDEFAILLPETNAEGAATAMAKVQSRLQEAARQQNWTVTFSVGVVTFANALESVEEMIKRADGLMYEVKRKGKSAMVSQVL
jgi:diguanylate cyclase (GGDEF)-like protein/PAS domain S-box-containing protein